MQFRTLSSETAALLSAGILTPAVAIQAGEFLTPAQMRGLWATHRRQQDVARAALAAWRRAV